MRGARRGSIVIVAGLVLSLTPAGAQGELTVVGSWASGDYGTGDVVDSESLGLRYVAGSTLVVRAEWPWLSAESGTEGVSSGAGPSRLGRFRPSGNGAPGAGTGVSEPGLAEGERTSGIGDLRVAASRALSGGGAKQLRFDAGAEVKVPTADESRGLGTGEWDFRVGGSGEYRFWAVTSYWGAGWNFLGDPPDIDLGDTPDAYVGLEGDAFGERIVVSGWLEGRGEIVAGEGDAALAGLELRAIGGPRFRVALTAGLAGGVADLSIIVGYSHVFGKDASGFRGMLR